MCITARQLNRATLDRQMLLRREALDVVDAVRRLLALQAQEAPSPYLALWNRLGGFDPRNLDAAFANRAIVKANLIRLTLHAVHADDWPVFYNAMEPSLRASRLNDRRYRSSGLSTADADGLLPELATFLAEPRANAEVEQFATARLGPGGEWAWWALRTYGPVHRAPTGGPWSFDKVAYLAARAGLGADDHERSVRHVLHRYLAAFGPATAQDFAQFTMLRQPVVKHAIVALVEDGAVAELAGPGGTIYDVAGAALPAEDVPAPPRLLPMWDSILLAYADRGRVIPSVYRPVVVKRNGDVLPALLVDGYVAGVWRPVDGGVEVTAFHRLSDDVWQGVAAEAAPLTTLLADRDPRAYGRFAHWWDKGLPSAEVRLLGD